MADFPPLVVDVRESSRGAEMLAVFDLSGISLGNLDNIIDIRKSDGWVVVKNGFDVYAFRMAAVNE